MKNLLNFIMAMIFTLVGVFSCIPGYAQEQKSQSSKHVVHNRSALKYLTRQYSKETIIFAIFYIEGNSSQTFTVDSTNFSGWNLVSLIDTRPDTVDCFILKYDNYLSGFGNNEKVSKVVKIEKWCSMHDLFSGINNIGLDETLGFEEIIYKLPETTKIYDKYIDKKAGQDYGSLDINTSCLIFYDFINYAISLSRNEQLKLISKYLKMKGVVHG